MYHHHLYLIENHTNMHVGSGKVNFDPIDNQIQRDPVTDYPTIHSSSLKGALKEYATFRHDSQEAANFIAHVFGDDDHAGKMRFVDASFLSVPMRASSCPYYLCTSPTAIAQFVATVRRFGIAVEEEELAALDACAEYSGTHAAIRDDQSEIETIKAHREETIDWDILEKYVGTPAALVPDAEMTKLLKDLPVIARNQLENGESKNLWYEEILPRTSRLYTVISEPTYLHDQDKKLANHFKRFREYLTGKEMIQIGANASVGYGLCSFTEVPEAGGEEGQDA